MRAASAKALGALGSAESLPKRQLSEADKDISVALALSHSLVQLKSNSVNHRSQLFERITGSIASLRPEAVDGA